MNRITCDGPSCGRWLDKDSPIRSMGDNWLHIEDDFNHVADLCSIPCLAEWADARLAPPTKRDAP